MKGTPNFPPQTIDLLSTWRPYVEEFGTLSTLDVSRPLSRDAGRASHVHHLYTTTTFKIARKPVPSADGNEAKNREREAARVWCS